MDRSSTAVTGLFRTTGRKRIRHHRSDLPFLTAMWGLGGSYLFLVVILIFADAWRTSPAHLQQALLKPEIQAAILLTLKTCTLSAILSVWVALPLAYLLTRQKFPGRVIVDTIVDIPLVLPPLVLGLSLLILFHLPFAGWQLETWLRRQWNFPVTYHVPSIVLAQFVVSAAFAVRTLRVTFDRIDPRAEDVARTLGCNRGQAFFRVCLPQAVPGILAAFTVAWARAMGEFGPILVFSGTTPFRTQVLSTAVYLELGIGNLEAAVAVSLLMVGLAIAVIFILRLLGTWTAA